MNGFSFLRADQLDWRSFVLLDWLGADIKRAIIGLGFGGMLIACTWKTESNRMHVALDRSFEAEQRFSAAARAVQKTQIVAARVHRLIAIDTEVRRIVASGTMHAAHLAKLANSLSERIALHQISQEKETTAFDGEAADWNALRGLLTRLSMAGQAMSLTGAQERLATGNIHFDIHLGNADKY